MCPDPPPPAPLPRFRTPQTHTDGEQCGTADQRRPDIFFGLCGLFRPPAPPLPPHHACGQVLLQWTRFFFSLKNVEDNRRWLVGNQRRLEGNHLDMWVASGLKIKLAGETAAVKMSKIGDVRTFGLHQTKDKKFLVELQWP